MKSAGAHDTCVRAFERNYEKLAAGDTGMMPEDSLEPLPDPECYADFADPGPKAAQLLSRCIVIKLNGGLGTSMGLVRAKSLLPVKEGLSFLDFIARQILWLREEHSQSLRFMLMNSFNTSADTAQLFSRYPQLGSPPFIELMQSQVPKIDAKTLQPCRWEKNPQLEWCPPGHGDIYPSLVGSDALGNLLSEGVLYAFVSNSDNLGATLDLRLLEFFASSGNSFVMEVAERTASDRKGGHLTKLKGRLALRESAQCPDADTSSFQDISRHKFFNTNNLWIRLDHLQAVLEESGGFLPLPIIRNLKTLDPRDKTTPEVIQLESAMGAAIQCFEKAAAVVVPRSRFAPVKTTNDLFALRSDAYRTTNDWRLALAKGVDARPPTVQLDSEHFKNVDQVESAIQAGVPSMADCDSLTVHGPVLFEAGNKFCGSVTINSASEAPIRLPAGSYKDEIVTLG